MTRKKRLSERTLVELRRSVGLPPDGPTRADHIEWSRVEFLTEKRDEGEVTHADA